MEQDFLTTHSHHSFFHPEIKFDKPVTCRAFICYTSEEIRKAHGQQLLENILKDIDREDDSSKVAHTLSSLMLISKIEDDGIGICCAHTNFEMTITDMDTYLGSLSLEECSKFLRESQILK